MQKTCHYRRFASAFPLVILTTVCFVLTGTTNTQAADNAQLRFDQTDSQIAIHFGSQKLATYYYADTKTTRPFFAHVTAPDGTQVTRNHPPKPNDLQDHPHYHPGIFLAFGDISGQDYWRLKAKVKHEKFLFSPQVDNGVGQFTVRNQYLSADGKQTVCYEDCNYQFHPQKNGCLITTQSKFHSDEHDFSFGDQEEMGLGVRMGTLLKEKDGRGRVLNSTGLKSAEKTWGQPAQWCDYSAKLDDKWVGVTIMASPKNASESWWHNRNYGLFVANMFGRKAMHQGETSRIVVKKGESFQLGYGVFVHASKKWDKTTIESLYSKYKHLTKE